MKESLLVLVLSVGLLFPACAERHKDFERLCKSYEGCENVESFGMDGLGCMLASICVGKDSNDISSLIRSCASFRILTCSGKEGEKLGKDIQEFIREARLEELVSICEEGAEMRIYAETRKNSVQQVFISIIDEERESFYLQLKGKFNLSDLQKMAKKSGVTSFSIK